MVQGVIQRLVGYQPPCLRRSSQIAGFVPRKPEDFGDGGAFPEIHVAQYPFGPFGMGRKDRKSGSQILASPEIQRFIPHHRLAADGRGLQDVQINDNFAKHSKALYLAEQKAREAAEVKSPEGVDAEREEKKGARCWKNLNGNTMYGF
ncbi:hypothetical protein ZIOFF_006902 [Zingiber officinale]|uniref:SKI-interacting protein SKIP SNW domain-containing protein n=1 Tax=Zingiber officinale TaxID=94328 RepID=A0A8J5IDK1_ZINOF|nr:hypothetical protein ZIOFF_006902 [Zingiber officinale]